MHKKNKIPVALLGATGLVGQHFVTLLANHPYFELAVLYASDQRAGQYYEEAVEWQMHESLPTSIGKMRLSKMEPQPPARLIFSALPSKTAYAIEKELAINGYYVISNASAHRFSAGVPNVVAEVNANHFRCLSKGKGFIVTNPNCTVSGLTLALKPLHHSFGITHAVITTMQALSGAGNNPQLREKMVDNLIPFIADEEDKIERETAQLLGQWDGLQFVPAPICLSAHCHRVQVSDGHTAAVSVQLRKRPTLEEIKHCWENYPNDIASTALPSAPKRIIIYREEEDRPQPKLDRLEENGMAVTVGRLRECAVHGYKFNLLVHNNRRGSAGSALLNAEYLLQQNYLEKII